MTGKCEDREYSIKMFCVLARDRKAVRLGAGGKVWEEARKAAGLGKVIKCKSWGRGGVRANFKFPAWETG